MTREEFTDWAEYFVASHGLSSEANTEMVLSWWPILGVFEASELRAASDALLAGELPRAYERGRYCQLLIKQIDRQRTVDGRQQLEQIQAEFFDGGECVLCGNAGLLSLPHWKCVRDGKWVPLALSGTGCYYSVAVWCSCRIGRFRATRHTEGKFTDILSLENYEKINPHWRRQLDQRAAEVEAGRTSQRRAKEFEAAMKEIAKRAEDAKQITNQN